MKSVKLNRGLLSYIILSVITFGIYPLWFLYKMKEDVNTICREDGKNTPGLIVLLLLSIVTCGIYAFVWEYQLCERIANYERRHNMAVDISGVKYFAWSILGSLLCGIGPLVAFHLLCKGLNNIGFRYVAIAANASNNSRPSSNSSSNNGGSSNPPSRGRLSDFGSSNSGSTDSFGNGSNSSSDSSNPPSRGRLSDFGSSSSGSTDSFGGGNRGSSSSSGKTDSFGNPIN